MSTNSENDLKQIGETVAQLGKQIAAMAAKGVGSNIGPNLDARQKQNWRQLARQLQIWCNEIGWGDITVPISAIGNKTMARTNSAVLLALVARDSAMAISPGTTTRYTYMNKVGIEINFIIGSNINTRDNAPLFEWRSSGNLEAENLAKAFDTPYLKDVLGVNSKFMMELHDEMEKSSTKSLNVLADLLNKKLGL